MEFESFIANLKKKHQAELEEKRAQIREEWAEVTKCQIKLDNQILTAATIQSAYGDTAIYGKVILESSNDTTLEKSDLDIAVDEFTVLINRICNTARTYGVQTWDDLTTKWKQQAQRLSQLSSQRERIRKTNDEVNSRLRFLKENEPKIREKMSAVTAETDHIKQLEKFSTSLLGPILDNIEYESLTEQAKEDFKSLHRDLEKQIAVLQHTLELDSNNAENLTPEELEKQKEIKSLIDQLSNF